MTKSRKSRYEASTPMTMHRVRARQTTGMPRPWYLRPFTYFAVAGAMFGLLMLWVSLDDAFYVYDAEIIGTVRTSEDEVFDVSGMPGLHILWVNVSEVEAAILETLPNIESARVSCMLPARCTIRVVERQPRVLWTDGSMSWWVDDQGVIFPASEGLAGGWTVRGSLPKDGSGNLDEPVRNALNELWASGLPLPQVLDYVQNRGLMYTDPHGWRVILGQGVGMEQRARLAQNLIADLEARGISPRFIDVRFPSAPYYSVTNEW
ncbi:MAG: FtsQ-type POTRA domain-containing protein [Chloroflexi bacterium]|nr:FtsQ-type POTRA domain-containing protein [Chloroflexota bacterium]